MKSNITQQELERFVLEQGAVLVGGCELDSSPIPAQENLKYAFSFAVKLTDSVLKTIEDGPSFSYFQHYRTANALLDNIAFKLSERLEEHGFNAYPVAASQSLGKNNPYRGVVAHKTMAVKSGLGYVGKSGLFLTAEYGSKVRLATVLTDMPLANEKGIMENACGNCERCVKACPSGAIFGTLPTTDGERNYDPEKCSKYMKEHFQDVGRGSVCGICIKVCPKNKLS